MFRFLRTFARSIFRTNRHPSFSTMPPTTIDQRIDAARSANLTAEIFPRHTIR
jgi:hypothetical protein